MHAIVLALFASFYADRVPDIDLGDQQFFQLYSRDQVRACRQAAMDHMYSLSQRYPLTEQEEEHLWAWKAEARYCYEVWNLLDDVQIYSKDYGQTGKEITLRKLSELRDRLGLPAYYSGKMPPPIPVWRFPRID